VTRRGRSLAFAAVIASSVLCTTPASAQEAPLVRVSATTSASVTEQCFTEPTTSPGSFTLERDSTAGALTVTYHVSGGPTDLNSDETAGADGTVDFADGAATVTVTVYPAISAGPSATVQVLDGTGYAPGDPASGTIEIVHFATTCLATSDTLPRTGSSSITGPLAVTGIAMVALGSLLLVAASRRKAAG
jgi:LPXTG-motif cell wall-anchored protein